MKKITYSELSAMKVAELRALALELRLEGTEGLKKTELRETIKSFLGLTDSSVRSAAKSKSSESAAESETVSEKKNAGRRTASVRKTSGEKKESSDALPDTAVTESRQESPSDSVKEEPEKSEGISEEKSVVQNIKAQDENTAESPADNAENAEKEAGDVQTSAEAEAGREQKNEVKPEKNEQRNYGDERPVVTGILDIADPGFGFLRFDNFLTSDKDIYVSQTQIRRFNLKTGDKIKGIARRPNEGERFGALLYVNTVNDDELGVAIHRPAFEDLTPIFPYERIRLENSRTDLASRIIDLVAPIGKGQRGLIVAPPKTGKTVLLKKIATTIEKAYPDIKVIVLLIDERPEEVTDMKESINGEVLYSTFDEQAEHHVKVAEMVLAHAQRLAEHKKDVVILLDSITRLARAYNMVVPSSGRTLSGGIDPGALHKPKKFFGAARKLREGGSITILATALVETGSRMDDVIFEEFKGTGNMELHLDRKLSEKRIFPAVNINKSGTRREDLLLDKKEMEAIWKIRRAMSNHNPQDVTENIIDNLLKTRCNADFLDNILKNKIMG